MTRPLSLLHQIENAVLRRGGSDISIRQTGTGNTHLAIEFVREGRPHKAILKTKCASWDVRDAIRRACDGA